ncbi:hypothetical protein JTE90_012647 [Oedothorax gibbosus]|uniref:Uncharacterized protein n=1 Tax=Oedothorax gibbosus TaxID=931172 RepID=A0AAV6TGE3_9ARAC|nr:hypothetical protein JTE90_012647 [Oedothorax gibbosus]
MCASQWSFKITGGKIKIQAGGGRPHSGSPFPRGGAPEPRRFPIVEVAGLKRTTLGPERWGKIPRQDEAEETWWRSVAVLTCKSIVSLG